MHNPIARKAFSVREVAEASSLSRSQVRNLISDGTLRAGRIGRRVIIKAEALDELLDSAPDARAA